MKTKTILILAALFLAGLALRVGIPYRQSQLRRSEYLDRKGAITILVDALYAYASTNGAKFPASLEALASLSTPSGQPIDTRKYLFNTNLIASHEPDHKRIIIAEDYRQFPSGRYFAVVQGPFVTAWGKMTFTNMLAKNSLLPQ
jgi:hypothetical protein